MKKFFWIVTFSILSQLTLLASNDTEILHASNIKACFKTNHCFNLEHANSNQKRKKGLMFRKTLPLNEGMLFSFKEKNYISMWMKNTYISLDIIWLNSNFQIICTKENTIPFDLTPLSCSKQAKYVIELNAGSIKNASLKKKDNVILSIISE